MSGPRLLLRCTWRGHAPRHPADRGEGAAVLPPRLQAVLRRAEQVAHPPHEAPPRLRRVLARRPGPPLRLARPRPPVVSPVGGAGGGAGGGGEVTVRSDPAVSRPRVPPVAPPPAVVPSVVGGAGGGQPPGVLPLLVHTGPGGRGRVRPGEAEAGVCVEAGVEQQLGAAEEGRQQRAAAHDGGPGLVCRAGRGRHAQLDD